MKNIVSFRQCSSISHAFEWISIKTINWFLPPGRAVIKRGHATFKDAVWGRLKVSFCLKKVHTSSGCTEDKWHFKIIIMTSSDFTLSPSMIGDEDKRGMKGGLPFRESQLVPMQQDILERTQSRFPHHQLHYSWLPLSEGANWAMSTPDEAEAKWCQMASLTRYLSMIRRQCPRVQNAH